MKAIVIDSDYGIEHLRLIERPMPEPRRGEIVVRMRAAALNYRDVEIVNGTYHTRFDLPLIPLSDGVGEVVAIGDDVTRVKPGDRVAAAFWQRWVGGSFDMADTGLQLGGPLDGVLAEYVRLDAEAVVHPPGHLTNEEVAALPIAGVTAWQALVTEGKLKAGDTVLVQGTGGVSIFALQFTKMFGGRAIVTSSSDEKLNRVQALGADGIINYARHPEWSAEVLALTDGQGADHIIEVGGPGSFAQSLKAVRRGGQINVIGYLGGKEGAINPLDIFRRQVRVRGIPVGPRQSFEAMNRAIALNQMRPVIDRVFAWTDIAEALRYLHRGKHLGKVALSFQ